MHTTDTFLFISYTTKVLLFKFRCNIFIGVRIIKDVPGSVASGTLYRIVHLLVLHEFLKLTNGVRWSRITRNLVNCIWRSMIWLRECDPVISINLCFIFLCKLDEHYSLRKLGCLKTKGPPIWRTAKMKKKRSDVRFSAKKKLHFVNSQCCRNTAIRNFPSHIPALQTIGLRLPCNCIPVQRGIRDMWTREMQLLRYTAKCFLYLSVPSSSTCSVTDIYTLYRTYANSSWRNWGNVFHSSNIWTKQTACKA